MFGTHAAVISGGSATWTIIEGQANGISEFDAYFNESTTRSDTLSLPATGNAAFSENSTNVLLTDPIRPFGVVPSSSDGRSRQATTLDFDTTNILGTWAISTELGGAFVSGGEQIAFTNMQRYTGPFTGALLYGDFALRYTGTKLVLTSNIDFLNAAFAEIGSPVISYVGDANSGTLTISGSLLAGGGLALLDLSAIPGVTNFGSFSMTASVIPEPTTGLLFGLGVSLFALPKRRRRMLT